MSSFKKIKYLSSILVLSCGFNYAMASSTYAKLTIINNSGSEMSADIVSSANPDNNPACVRNTYDFNSNTWIQGFNHDSNTVSLSQGVTNLTIETSCLVGGARIYIAQGSPSNNFNANMSDVPGTPNLDLYANVYDIAEMGWPTGETGTAVWNTSVVDGFGLALEMTDGKTTVGFKDTDSQGNPVTRALVNKALKDAYDVDPSLYVNGFFRPTNDRNNFARIYSPLKLYTRLTSPNWDAEINNDLDNLVNNQAIKPFYFQYGQFEYSNLSKTSNNSITATCYDTQTKTTDTCTLSNITTGSIVGGQVTFSPSKEVAGKFAGMISTVINRGVLAHPEFWGTNGQVNTGDGFYQYWYTNGTYNEYAKVITSFGINNKIYANSYDDFWQMDSSLSIGPDNNHVTLTIMPLE